MGYAFASMANDQDTLIQTVAKDKGFLEDESQGVMAGGTAALHIAGT